MSTLTYYYTLLLIDVKEVEEEAEKQGEEQTCN